MRSSQYQQYHDGPAVSKSCSVKLNQWCRCHLSLVGREDPSSFTVCSYRFNLQQLSLIVIREFKFYTCSFTFKFRSKFIIKDEYWKPYKESWVKSLTHLIPILIGKILGGICGYLAVCLGRKSLIEYQSTSKNYIFLLIQQFSYYLIAFIKHLI